MRPFFAPWSIPGETPLVRLDNVTKRFGGVTAVNQLSLDIFEREFFALLGPSGCGKSTLLRLLAGLEQPDEGRILIAGEDVAGMPPYRRPVNMMFQSYALFPHLSVAGNIGFGLKQEGLPRREIRARVEELLALVKLEGLSGRRPHQLSGGQAQRVALARALAKRPKVLLLDEPMAALDKKLRAETQFELTNLQDKIGTTFIIVTHDQEEAMTVSHRIAVMNAGQIAQVAPPAEIYERPNSRWVADFIGDVNLIEGTVMAAEPGVTVVMAPDGQRYRIAPNPEAWPGTRAWVALRPEKLKIAATPPPHIGDNCAAGTVWDIGYLGRSVIYKVRLDSGMDMKASVVNQTRLVELPIAKDDRVWLTWEPAAGVVLTH